MDNLSFQYPSWYLILCLLLGLVLAALLYWRDKRFTEYGRWVPIVLGAMRFVAVSGLATLLLSPLLKQTSEEIKNPSIILLQDNSESIRASMDDPSYENYQSGLAQISDQISEKYELIKLGFGDKVTIDTDTSALRDKVTNLSKALSYINDTYNDQNLGAIILATDGIFNEGKNPLYQNLKFKAPIYSVALGDTTIKRDLSIKHVYHNKIAYLGDKFGIQVDIQAKNATGSRSKLRLQRRNGESWSTVKEENLLINSNDFFETKSMIIDADRAGVNRYRVVVNQITDESSNANNLKDIYVEVLDARQKILVMANSPNPDIAAIKALLESNKNYVLTIKYPKDQVNIVEYDFVIFHNLPSKTFDIKPLLDRMEARKTPRFFMVGQQTNFRKFNSAQNVLTISGKEGNSNEVTALFANNFNLFNTEDKTAESLEKFVPVVAPFGKFKEGPKTNTLLYQKIGNIVTKYPLLSFSEENGIKTGVFVAEGFWKWKLFEYLQFQNFDVVKDLLTKAITYTSVKEDKRKFRVTANNNIYKENEHIYFDAELYNNSYQLINEPEVFITIKKDGKEEFQFTFSKRDQTYSLDAGVLEEGSYTYESYVNYEGKKLSQKGSFSVQSIQLELFNLTADHNLLNTISTKYGGKLFQPNEISQLTETLLTSNSIKPIVYPTTTTKSIINVKWLMGLLGLLLLLEWFLRRYFGSY